MEKQPLYFHQFLATAFNNGNYATDDVIAFVLPLYEEVLSFHEAGMVAPFEKEEALLITNNRLDVDEQFTQAPMYAQAALDALFNFNSVNHFDVAGSSKIETDVDEGAYEIYNLQVNFNGGAHIQHPAFIKGYNCFEILVGHHDAQTDIFCLGLVLGSMALGLDLYEEEDVKLFAEYRYNPVQFNNRIHPTISTLITEMTALNRQQRTQDLYDVIQRLKNYRDYDPEKQTDLSNIPGWVNKNLKERSQLILNKLRNRLFDTTRRNRMLYYKPNMRFVNLTISSVPMVLHYQSIRPGLLFTWNSDVAQKIVAQKEIVLNKYLRFEDHAYLPAALDKIRLESDRDVHEFGFSQLKIVITFLNWHNLREEVKERIKTPLLLIPVALKKAKRLKEDYYTLKVLDNVAEVNPVLANQLRELYGIQLPDFIDLDEMTPEQFYALLKAQIDNANQGIKLYYSNKPKIKLVHTVAKQTVNNYKKRLRKKETQLDSYKNIAYSYQPENYKPLGLEIFKQHVEPRPSLLEFLVNDDITLTPQQLTGNTKERALFEIVESEHNPYSWDFDMCNMVLGNFNYKKMSLVQDYNQVIDAKLQHNVFESLFSNLPKQVKEEVFDLNNPQDWNHVITADPTQTQAILKSRLGESYIIQGPPGTGKSQTITNLIADFVARGKSILFVCEKRAALDVVYHRLKQNGLDELCCYIHDSQGDKREFIKNLKLTYEDFSKNRMDVKTIEAQREAVVKKLNEHLQMLHQFHFTNTAKPGTAGIEVSKLIHKLIELKKNIVPLALKQQELLPVYNEWIQFGETITQLSHALEETGAEPTFATHPLSKLNDAVFVAHNPLNILDSLVTNAKNLLGEIKTVINECKLSGEHSTYLEQVKNLVQHAVLLEPLALHNNLNLVDNNKPAGKQFDEKINAHKQLEQQYKQAQQNNSNWKNKLTEQDLNTAISITAKNEKSFFNFLNAPWKKLKKQLNECYDFSQHQIKPGYAGILQQLQQEYDAANTVAQNKNNLQNAYKLNNLDIAYLGIETLRNKRGDKEIDYLLAHPNANNIVKRLYKLNNNLYQLEQKLQQCLYKHQQKSIIEIEDELESVAINAESLHDLLPALQDFAALPPNIKNALRDISLTPVQAEASIAQKTLQQFYQQNKNFATTDVAAIEKAVQQIKQCYQQLLKLNAEAIRSNIRQRFVEHVELSNTAVSQLNEEQKQFKKNYNEGRKVLENEFNKSMRYKSIRELSAKESGLVLKDIKPIWLMSPLSVSDSLPLNANYFDVVIFDEASQITLEEGVPALYRSTQTIIVGDDKQMPPTNFFTAKTEDPDDLENFNEEDDTEELLNADADSLLVQGARKLSSTMLSWHYRSHYETLISYSNHAFYDAALLTIPDKAIHHSQKQNIEITTATDADNFIECLYNRSISFHFHANSVYEKRNNQAEANYIAQLVKGLLTKKVTETIGIVAFSQQQQQTIEEALTALAQTDSSFETLLEEAYNKTENDQFVGLIIKNLENIQGDERDIIIMSVCYGFDAKKKMLMNFGPINKKGGEKRLNVIFSRAKKHMAVVSSIRHHHITNEYNEGANYFRRFLQYAESVSTGNMQTARAILDSLVVNKSAATNTVASNIVLTQIKQQLQSLGYEVAAQIGQSDFKCSLAVKANITDNNYTLSILLDDDKHYANTNLTEQYYQRPAILQSFGWRTMHVFAKDWLQQPEKVMQQIIKHLQPVSENETIEQEVETPLSITETTTQTPAAAVTTLQGFEDVAFERFVFDDGNSSKFWEAALQQARLIVRFGRVGTKGQVLLKTFENEASALQEKNKLVKEKLANGYLPKQ
jgi:superfamily I DNA and/or RNA helicase/predicted DNA-binding WGR domain protein